MIIHTIFADGSVHTSSDKPSPKDLQNAVGGFVEYVSVLFNEKPSTMIVNEIGAIQIPKLPINARATLIYLTYAMSNKHDINPLNVPLIYGDVVLLEGISKQDL